MHIPKYVYNIWTHPCICVCIYICVCTVNVSPWPASEMQFSITPDSAVTPHLDLLREQGKDIDERLPGPSTVTLWFEYPLWRRVWGREARFDRRMRTLICIRITKHWGEPDASENSGKNKGSYSQRLLEGKQIFQVSIIWLVLVHILQVLIGFGCKVFVPFYRPKGKEKLTFNME